MLLDILIALLLLILIGLVVVAAICAYTVLPLSDFINALLRRVDDLRDGSQDEWAVQLRAELLAMLNPDSDRCVVVKVGYPTATAHLPWVSIILSLSWPAESCRRA